MCALKKHTESYRQTNTFLYISYDFYFLYQKSTVELLAPQYFVSRKSGGQIFFLWTAARGMSTTWLPSGGITVSSNIEFHRIHAEVASRL